MRNSVQGRFLEHLERNPEGRAVAYFDRDGRCDWWTRRELHVRAVGVAAALAAEGVGRGDVCVISAQSAPTLPALILGCLLRGSAPLLVAPAAVHSSSSDLATRVAAKVSARLVVQRESPGGAATPGGPPVTTPEALCRLRLGTPEDLAIEPSAVVAMQMTSGTTGSPRVCVWEQRAVLAALDGMAAVLDLGPDAVFFNWTPLHHDLGLVNNFLFCLVHGVPVALMSPLTFVRDPALWLRGLTVSGATATWSPNFGFSLVTRRAREEQLDGIDLSRVSSFWNAAERVHHATMLEFRHRFEALGVKGRSLKASYGCAENVGGATFTRGQALVVEHVDRAKLRAAGVVERVESLGDDSEPIVGVGRPHPGVQVRILADSGERLNDGEVGQIVLETHSAMSGYFGEVEADTRVQENGLLYTGDLGYLRAGELFWVGRLRERISVRGQKIDPSELEEPLLGIPALREGCFAAFGVDDPGQGTQRLVVVVEMREPIDTPLEKVEAIVRRRLFDRLQVTAHDIVLVRPGTLTKTSSGKRRNSHYRSAYLQDGLSGIRITSPC